MSSLDRRSLLAALGALLAISGCGFTPVHAPGGAGAALSGAVEVDKPRDRESYELVKRLEERLGRAQSARYRLNYEIDVTRHDAGVTAAQEITRTRLAGTLRFGVTSAASGLELDKGEVTSFTSFSNLGSTVSTASVERDAYRRLMVILADMVVTRLIAAQPGWGE